MDVNEHKTEMKLEICVDSVESSVNAESGGADRLELCSALELGGITPGPGIIQSVLRNVSIPVNVIIRPRGGDFLYSDQEFEVMRSEIDFAGEAGAAGVVLGILREDGMIDVDRTAYLVECAGSMSVTFHRAFDMAADTMTAIEDVISAGAVRLLTSGQSNSAAEGTKLIRKLVDAAGARLIIMPGGGLNEGNIRYVATTTGATEFHLTGRKMIESGMKFRREGIGLGHPALAGEEYILRYADMELIKRIKTVLSAVY